MNSLIYATLAVALPAVGSDDSSDVATLVTLIVTIGTIVIFVAALWLIAQLWRLVISVVEGRDVAYVHAIRDLLGAIQLGGERSKPAVVGTGLLGTITILFFAYLVIRYGLSFHWDHAK